MLRRIAGSLDAKLCGSSSPTTSEDALRRRAAPGTEVPRRHDANFADTPFGVVVGAFSCLSDPSVSFLRVRNRSGDRAHASGHSNRSVASIPQHVLNIEAKARTNPLPWRGQFSPQLVEALLDNYAKSGDVVLDPFVGSGTVLAECARKGMAAWGTEVNPAAAILARTYSFTNLDRSPRRAAIGAVDRILTRAGFDDAPLFAPKPAGPSLDVELVAVGRRLRNDDARRLFETLSTVCDGRPNDRILSTWRRLRAMVSDLPFASRPISVALCDARRLPVADASIDLVITSPPYINVFNYHQQHRSTVEAMGWDVLAAARSEIGSNRKHRGNRLLTVIQYCLDMTMVLVEARRVLRPKASMVIVVGRESNVRKTAFFNGRIIRRLVEDVLGARVDVQRERVFTNRFGRRIYGRNRERYQRFLEEHPIRLDVVQRWLDHLSGCLDAPGKGDVLARGYF